MRRSINNPQPIKLLRKAGLGVAGFVILQTVATCHIMPQLTDQMKLDLIELDLNIATALVIVVSITAILVLGTLICLENARMVLVEEMKKKQPNGTLISQMMDQSFPLRRQEIVKKVPAVQNVVERWPALFTERQVFAEFNRIASKNLEGDFFEALDQYAPRFIELFKTKKGTVGQKLRELMQHMSWMTPDVTVLRSVVLKGIPILLGDDSSEFYKTCSDTARDEALECITVGVLTVVSEDSPHEGQSSVDLQPISTAIILEGGIVMDHIKNLPQAVCLLFGLTYALHLDYPKCMANTLNFIQTVMLGLGKKNLRPKLLTVFWVRTVKSRQLLDSTL